MSCTRPILHPSRPGVDREGEGKGGVGMMVVSGLFRAVGRDGRWHSLRPVWDGVKWVYSHPDVAACVMVYPPVRKD